MACGVARDGFAWPVWASVPFVAAACCGLLQAPIGLALVPGLLVAAATDLSTGFIFDEAVVAIALPSTCLALLGGRLEDATLGGLVCGGMLLSLNVLSNGRGMGLGDVKLGAAIGVALGLAAGWAALCIAILSAGAAGATMLAAGRARRRQSLRFGPYLALGAVASLLWWRT
jgi:prepilin signal peptidase PulO-like enzyme (type II secretory pathway)